MLDPLGAKITFVAARAQGIKRNQSYRVIVNRVFDKLSMERKISAKGLAQIHPAVFVAGQDVDRRTRLCERGHCLTIFVLPSIMDNISGVNDYVGCRIMYVDIRNRKL